MLVDSVVGGRCVVVTSGVVVDSIVGSRWNVVTSAMVVDSMVGGRCVVVTSGVVVSLFSRGTGTFTIANSLLTIPKVINATPLPSNNKATNNSLQLQRVDCWHLLAIHDVEERDDLYAINPDSIFNDLLSSTVST
jgi:hypothetical protein